MYFLTDTIAYAETLDIIALAEGCITDDGPAIYVAQVIASMENYGYTLSTSCTPVTPRSSDSNTGGKDINNITFSPNPVTDRLNFEKYLDAQHLQLIDTKGLVIMDLPAFSGNHVDLDFLEPGMYVLNVVGGSSPIKFIKI